MSVTSAPEKRNRRPSRKHFKGIPTAAAISEIAGVSKSTVSRALKNDRTISEETRRRILAIAVSVGYMPNAMARGLTTRQSGVIGFVTAELEHYYYQEHLQRLGRLAAQRGLQIMLFQVPSGGDMSEIVPAMTQYRLEGAILIATAPTSVETIATCARYKIKTVVLNRSIPNSAASAVICDQFHASREAAHLLSAAGHHRIGFVAGRANNPIGESREAGFMAGLAEVKKGLSCRVDGQFTFDGGLAAGREIATMRHKPHALFVANDLMAFGVIEAMREARIRVPQDISIIGFDNSRIGAWPSYNLTTFAQPMEQMFNRAIDLIVAHSGGVEQEPEDIYIRAQLVVRGSALLPPGTG